MINENINLEKCNGILVVFDSCRFDSAQIAKTPNLDNTLGTLHQACAPADYTQASHQKMFAGHLPCVPNVQKPYYNQAVKQLWRILTGPARDRGKSVGLLFRGHDVITGYRNLEFYVLGVGGVSQFSQGGFLRKVYPWSDFFYYGYDLDSEPWKPRTPDTFPLNHIPEIVEALREQDNWFLFINCQATHYPFDIGNGIDIDMLKNCFPVLNKNFNIKSCVASEAELDRLRPFNDRLHQMQIAAVEYLDRRIGELFLGLSEISKKPIYGVVCADHGDEFGDEWLGISRYGHLLPYPNVMRVPLWLGMVNM